MKQQNKDMCTVLHTKNKHKSNYLCTNTIETEFITEENNKDTYLCSKK